MRKCIPYVLLVYAVHLVVAAVASYPASAIATRALGARHDGDAALFAPGSLLLAELFRLHGVAIEAWATQAALIVAMMIPVGIATNAILLAAIAAPQGTTAGDIAARAVSSLRSLAIAWVLYAATGAGVAALCYAGSEGARGTAHTPGRDIAGVAVLAVGGIVWFVGGVAHDVTRAAVVTGRLDVPGAVLATWQAMKRSGWGLVAAWWFRAATGALLVLLEVAAMRSIPWLTSSGTWLSFIAHQAIVVALLLLRFSWLARVVEETAGVGERERVLAGALRGSRDCTVTDEVSDTAARTDELAGPS